MKKFIIIIAVAILAGCQQSKYEQLKDKKWALTKVDHYIQGELEKSYDYNVIGNTYYIFKSSGYLLVIDDMGIDSNRFKVSNDTIYSINEGTLFISQINSTNMELVNYSDNRDNNIKYNFKIKK